MSTCLDSVYLLWNQWLQKGPTLSTLIAQDNNTCMFLVQGSGMYARAQHIDTRVRRVRELMLALNHKLNSTR